MVFSRPLIKILAQFFQGFFLFFQRVLKDFNLIMVHMLLKNLQLVLVFLDQRLLFLLLVKDCAALTNLIRFEVLLLLELINVLNFQFFAEIFEGRFFDHLKFFLELLHLHVEVRKEVIDFLEVLFQVTGIGVMLRKLHWVALNLMLDGFDTMVKVFYLKLCFWDISWKLELFVNSFLEFGFFSFQILDKPLYFWAELFDVSVQLCRSQIKIEQILRVMPSRDHPKLELSPIKRNQILAFQLSLKLHSRVKIFANDPVRDKEVNSHLNLAISFSSDVDDVTQELSLIPLQLLMGYFLVLISWRDIFKDKHVLPQTLFLQELSAILWGLHGVNDQVPQVLGETYFNTSVILFMERFD